MPESNNKYYGKYRGTCTNNVDPMKAGRIQVQVSDVLGLTPSSWAEPCVPFAGLQMGMFCVPDIGAGVWVEFEQGELSRPVWVGCFWGGAAAVPALALAGTPGLCSVVVQTTLQNTLMLSDTPGPTGGILLKSKTGAMIAINETGITISNGQGATIMMSGPSITINQGALVIT